MSFTFITQSFASTPLIFSFGPQGMPLWVVGPSFIGIAIFFLGRKLRVPAIKWAGLLPLLFGLFVGINASIEMGNALYSDYWDMNSKRRMMHVATAIVPLVSMIGMAVFDKLTAKAASSRL